jgi:hypothetical protein
MIFLAIQILCLCLLLAGAETLHGIARTLLVVPRIGNQRAKQYSTISGTLLAFAVCYFMVPMLELHGSIPLLLLGLVTAVFMASFDVALARFVVKQRWDIVFAEFNPAKGSWLIFGLLTLVFIPFLVMKLKGLA